MSENKSNVVELKLYQGGKTEEGPATNPEKPTAEKQLMFVVIDSPSGLSRHFMHDDTLESLREFMKNPHARLFELYDPVENCLFALTPNFSMITAMTVEKANELGALKPGDPGYVVSDEEKQKQQELQEKAESHKKKAAKWLAASIFFLGMLNGLLFYHNIIK